MKRSDDTSPENPEETLRMQARNALSSALFAERKEQQAFESLKNVGQEIGTEYGDRVIFELIQNAHDAHSADDDGAIAIKLLVTSENDGQLMVANRGAGFRRKDLDAIINIATSAKEIGEGIGNKGLGFRSIETITDDVHIYSKSPNSASKSFDGYCFRFAREEEIRDIILSDLQEDPAVTEVEADRVSRAIPRYLVPIPLPHDSIPEEIERYSARNYASVILAPLRGAVEIDLVRKQIERIANLEHPLLLFLDRVSQIRLETEFMDDKILDRRLSRSQKILRESDGEGSPSISEVSVGEGRRFLLVRKEVEKKRVLAAVDESIGQAPAIRRWKEWKGQPSISVAVGLSTDAVLKGQLYNFLPMGDEAVSPLLGHIDAPFYADIDRRNIDPNLPLNNLFLDAAAETCASAALTIVDEKLDIPQRCAFDLIAWTGNYAQKMDDALDARNQKISKIPVIPIIPIKDGDVWSTLENVTIWPDAEFLLLKPPEIVKHVGVGLTSNELDELRLERLRLMARRCFVRNTWAWSRLPMAGEISEWMGVYAQSLLNRGIVRPSIWMKFYTDLITLCKESYVDLSELADAEILLDRSGKLRCAGKQDERGQGGIFVRSEGEKGKRKIGDIPMPPSSLTRTLRFLHEKIEIPDEVLQKFIDADLLRKFNPKEVLADLGDTLAETSSSQKRMDALYWAFRLLEASVSTDLDEAVANAGLYVPTLGGWFPADQAIFSGSWTRIGGIVESFLFKASEYSEDCKTATQSLLKPLTEWDPKNVADIRKWEAFLRKIGVTDGLKPYPAKIVREGSPSHYWTSLFHSGDAKQGMGSEWANFARKTSFNNPNARDYKLNGEFWRLAGQIEYGDFPDHLHENFYELLVAHLTHHGNKFLEARIGRYGLQEAYWDERRVATPLGAFLRSKAWLLGERRSEREFLSPGECWASRTKRPGIPTFIRRLSDDANALIECQTSANVPIGEELGLLDWNNPNTAPQRLATLAESANNLHSGDMMVFRREYSRAWEELTESDAILPSDLSLAVHRYGKLECICGDASNPIEIWIVQKTRSLEAKALSAAKLTMLEVGEAADIAKVEERFDRIKSYSFRKLDRDSVRLLVDSDDFAPMAEDNQLVSLGLEWLPEFAVFANEVLGENLERGIQGTTLDKKIRSIKVRECNSLSLMVGDQDSAIGNGAECYAFEDDTNPTLILKGGAYMNWPRLAKLAGEISKLVDSRLRSLERGLLRLSAGHSEGVLVRPDDEDIANALQCDIEQIEEMRAGMRTDLAHILHLLVPAIAYFEGAGLALKLGKAVRDEAAEFEIRNWLVSHLSSKSPDVDHLLETCKANADRRTLVKALELDYGKFNRALQSLDQVTISSEADLRATFNAYLTEMKPELRDRLRHLHFDDFQRGNDLSTYCSRLNLEFIPFDPSWVLDFETLEHQSVVDHVEHVCAEFFGRINGSAPPSYEKTIKVNRRRLRDFAKQARPVIGAWCRKHNSALPGAWEAEEAQQVVHMLENAGLLDFVPVNIDHIPSLCLRAGAWPSAMPETIALKDLNLDNVAVQNERDRKMLEQKERDRQKRTISFNGQDLDAGDPSFGASLQSLAEEFILADDSWYTRSKPPKLNATHESGKPRFSEPMAIDSTNRTRRARWLSETQRGAMGFAGEWLAYQYLKRKFPSVNEDCWISGNRSLLFAGGEGNDYAGYDFFVPTPRVEWMYEVKSTLEDGCEFELTANEIQAANSATRHGRLRYRILFVQFVFEPEKWRILELPNPMDKEEKDHFSVVGQGSLKMRFNPR